MVDFWSNHLNVTCPSSDVWSTRHLYDSQVIRKHALGKFSDMLVASARHPAMLLYLDNANSSRKAPNENYARELLELHTVGLVYSEADVKAAARLLTGLSVDTADLVVQVRPADARHRRGEDPRLEPRQRLGGRRGGCRSRTSATSPSTRRRRGGSPASWPCASCPTTRRPRS